METPLIISKVEIDELLKLLPSDEAQRTLSFIDALKVFDRAADKKRCAAEIAARLEPLGYKGLSLKSLYRKLDQFREIPAFFNQLPVTSFLDDRAVIHHQNPVTVPDSGQPVGNHNPGAVQPVQRIGNLFLGLIVQR